MFSNKDLKRLIIPLVIEQLLAVAVGFADSIMIASVGEAAVSGVSLVDNIMILLINIFSAMATGGAVIAGQYLGKRRPKRASEAADQLVLFTTGLSIVITLLVYLLRGFILHVVFGQIEADVMHHADVYLLIVTASIPFIALYNGCAALFRAMGNSKISMETSVLMNAINITGNAILIYGVGLGVAGAAIPTLISRIVAAVVLLVRLRRQEQEIHLSRPFCFRWDWPMIKKILHIGVPNGLENSMFQLGKILVLSLVASFGTSSIAANAVSNSVALFQVLPGMAMGFAVISVISQCVGARDYEQAKYYTKKLMKLTYGAMVVLNILVVLALPLILRMYNLSAETGKLVEWIIIYHAICVVTVWPISFTLPNTLRAANDVKFSMIISIVSMWIFRIGFSFVLGKTLGWGVFGVWVAMTIDWFFRAVCFAMRYVRGKWMELEI